MNEAAKIIQMIFVANYYSPVIVHPGKKSFVFPTPLITTQFSAVLSFCLLSVSLMQRDHFKSKAVGDPPLMYGIAAYFAVREAVKAFNQKNLPKFEAPFTPEKILMNLYSNTDN